MVIEEVEALADISAEATICTFTITTTGDLLISVQILLGNDGNPIIGSANYSIRLYINGYLMVPAPAIQVSSGADRIILSSRTFLYQNGDVVTVTVTGAAGDTNVYTKAQLMDWTPVRAEDLNAVVAAISDMDIIVKPTVTLLGPAKQSVKTFTLPKKCS